MEEEETPLDSAPDTGDTGMGWIFVIAAALSASGIVIVSLKKKEN
ncbi:MAG: LPXTG cell wall anchor domain-containing protein [Oscillospiraceae bacterium]|nr:LPXTG cell wall anchor domain-containing protein [Oscillospiraceae bacterium]